MIINTGYLEYMPQLKRISKYRRQEVERVAESEIVLNWHVFFSIFVRDIEEKLE